VSTQIFVNLPVKDLQKSIAFFTKLGFTFNPQFTNENATCMIIGENIFAMLLVEKFFQTFTKKAICDATKSIEVLVCISRESRADVDNMVKNAAAAGGTIPRPAQDHGFMYTQAFEDIDGHTWELTYMAPTADTKA
jgi:uncharacterized protein